MKAGSKLLALISMIFLSLGGFSQKKLDVGGYQKFMQTFLIPNDVDGMQIDNLLHNRLELDWRPTSRLNFFAAARTRVFYGDLVKSVPGYVESVTGGSNDYFDIDRIWFNKRTIGAHTVIDRLYGKYNTDKWSIQLGRQRVNWGISTVWNPNDLFNAFNYTDFDYEERPGSDALRITRHINWSTSAELAVRVADKLEDMVVAGRYRFNVKGSTDIQIIGGKYFNDLAMGGGFATNVGQSGLKGEATYFLPLIDESEEAFSATASWDYSFEEGTYIMAGGLYNSQGQQNSVLQLFSFQLSAKNLYPYKWSGFFQAQHPVTPLLNVGSAFIYSPTELNPLFVNPTITYSLSQNLDFDLVGQIVFEEDPSVETNGYKSPLQALFMRFKYSY